MAKDPVCGMKVDEKSARYTSVVNGEVYYFCSDGCRRDFQKDPSKYVHHHAGRT